MKRFCSASTVFVTFVLLCCVVAGPAMAATGFISLGRSAVVKPQIAAGPNHTVVLKGDGSLYAWGLNVQGQLGDGTNVNKTTPTRIGTANDWVAVACGDHHTVALKSDGSLYAWGNNAAGQLGDGTTASKITPTRIGTANDWVTVACGESHTVAVKSDGSLYAWGGNTYGQLGDGTNVYKTSPTRIGAANDWVAVACGTFHTVALKSDGSLYAWGYNGGGQLGDGTTVQKTSPTRIGTANDWATVACGDEYSLALKSDGSLYAWGNNIAGQLGDGTNINRTIPTRIGTASDWIAMAGGANHTVALKSDGSLHAWGWNPSGQLGDGTTVDRTTPTRIGTANDWTALACGFAHTLALKSNGSLQAWGYNAYGQLGDGTTVDRFSPTTVTSIGVRPIVVCGSYHTVALKSDGSLYAWGANMQGQLGDGTTVSKSSPIRIGGANDWVAVAGGGNHTVALKSDGSLYAWGYNTYGQLGDGTTTQRNSPTRIGAANDWVAIACSQLHTIALKSDGSLYAWGYNGSGQLGDGTTTQRNSPTRIGAANDWVAVACGQTHTLALKSDGSLYAWGDNSYGQLGDGTIVSKSSPTRIGTAVDWVTVAGGTGGAHSVALKSNGSLYAWGYNTSGQLGDGTTVTKSSPTRIGTAIDWVAVATNGSHNVALRSNGAMYSWGLNSNGQLGDGTTVNKTSPTRIGTAVDWVAVACGYAHSAALTSEGPLFAWGDNVYGQLGDGTTVDKPSPGFILDFSDITAPAIGTLASSTHPVQSAWYADDSPAFGWTAGDASGVSGYSYVLDQAPDTDPDTISEGSGLSTSFTGKADGVWYFHVRAVDRLDNWGPTSDFTIRIDTAAPTGGAVVLGSGSGFVNDSWVTLHLSVSDLGPTQYQARNAGDTWPSGWTDFADSVTWGLPPSDGVKTVEVRYRDAAGNVSESALATARLDTTLPVGWLLVADGADAVSSTATTVETWAMDMNGPVLMRIKNGGAAWPASWSILPVGDQPWTLPSGDGNKNVYVEFVDAAGNIALLKQSVILDTTAPTGALTIDGGAYATADPAATLGLTALDANAPIEMRLRDAGGEWGEWQRHDGSVPWTLPGADGAKAVEVQYRDIAGNTSPVFDGAIVLDRVAPTLAPASVGAGAWCRFGDTAAANASDAGSGLAASAQRYRVDGGAWTDGSAVTLKTTRHGDHFNGAHTVEFTSADRAGNVTTGSVTVRLDSMGPLTGNDAPTGTVTTPVTVTLIPVDAGCGVGSTWWSLNGGAWHEGTSVALTPPPTGTAVRTITYYSLDKLGNAEAFRSVEVTMAAESPVQALKKGLVRWTPVRPAAR